MTGLLASCAGWTGVGGVARIGSTFAPALAGCVGSGSDGSRRGRGGMNARARRVQQRVALANDEHDGTSMLDLGGAARASRSLDGFLNNVAMRIATTTKASPVSILLRDGVTGRFYCRYRYPTLSAGLNSEPIWLDKDAFVVR